MIAELIYCAFCSCFAAAVQTVSGFGYGIIVMALLPHVIPSTVTCAVMIGLTAVVNSFAISLKYRGRIRFSLILLPLITYIPMSYLAVTFAGNSGEGVLRIILGIVLILLGLYFFFIKSKLKIKPTPLNALSAGGIAGILSGLFSTGGPPMVVYLKGVTEDTDEYIGCIQVFFMLTNLYTSVVRGLKGMITPYVLKLALAAMAASILGVKLGRKALGKIGEKQQNIVINSLMILSGILLLI